MIPVVACPDRQQLDSAFVSTSLYNKVEKKNGLQCACVLNKIELLSKVTNYMY